MLKKANKFSNIESATEVDGFFVFTAKSDATDLLSHELNSLVIVPCLNGCNPPTSVASRSVLHPVNTGFLRLAGNHSKGESMSDNSKIVFKRQGGNFWFELENKSIAIRSDLYGDLIGFDFSILELTSNGFGQLSEFFYHHKPYLDLYNQFILERGGARFPSNDLHVLLEWEMLLDREKLSIEREIHFREHPHLRPKPLPTPKPVKTGYIYLMRDLKTGFHKIGFSQSPKVREKTLQAQEPLIELLFAFQGTMRDERDLHEQFNAKRLRGEWFDLNEAEVSEIKDKYKLRQQFQN